MDRWQARMGWVQARKRWLRRWVVRIAAFYFGYKILHREIYEVEHAEPLLIALGLWLCGIAPADMFDGLRRVGDGLGQNIDKAAGGDELEAGRAGDKTANGDAVA